jgi:hypothetical protein
MILRNTLPNYTIQNIHGGFQVTIKSIIFWDVTPCSLVEV